MEDGLKRRVAKAAAISLSGLAVLVASVVAAELFGDPFLLSVQVLATVALVAVTLQYVRLTADQVRSTRDQVTASERALRVTNERAAREQSLMSCQQFVNEFVPAYWTFRDELSKKSLPLTYAETVGDFTPTSLSDEATKNGRTRVVIRSGIVARNLLEVFAAAFMYGVADEKIAYAVDGRAYCSYVASMYDCIALARSAANPETWQPIVDLYHLWNYRLSAGELAEARERLDEELTKATAAEAAAPKAVGS